MFAVLRQAGSKRFFFEKKNQKTFIRLGTAVPQPRPKRMKSLLLLYFRKEVLTCFLQLE